MLENNQTCVVKSSAPLEQVPIASVRCRVFRARSADGVAMSFGAMHFRTMFLVQVEFADGTSSYGESWVNYPSWGWQERIATVTEGIAPLLVGQTFSSTRQAHDLLVSRLVGIGRQWGALGPIFQAISAVDAALWVRAAHEQDASLSELISKKPLRAIPAYGSSLGPTGVAESAERCLELGLRAAKVKVGFGAGKDKENLMLARTILGDDYPLFADANRAWKFDEATEMVRVLRDYGVHWIEEPLTEDSPVHIQNLYEASDMPIALGENLYGADAFTPYLQTSGIEFLQPDLSKVGGVSDYLDVVSSASSAQKRIAPHLYNGAFATALTIQMAATADEPTWVEWDIRSNALRTQVDHLLRDGAVTVPQGIGLGTDIDMHELSQYEINLGKES